MERSQPPRGHPLEAQRPVVSASPHGTGAPVDERCREADRLLDEKRPGDALALCKQVLSDKPDDVVAAFMAAKCLLELKEPQLAYHLFRSLYGLDRTNPEVWANIGHCLAEIDHPDTALDWFQRCHAALKGTSNHWSNMASILARLGRPEAAIEAGEQALALDGQNLDAKYNLALPYLSMRRWPEGWHCYDQVIGKGKLRPNNDYSPDGRSVLPWWEGIGGNPVIFGEQGLGDAIMFASMLPDAIACAEKVIVDIDLRLFDLFKRSFPQAILASTSGGMNMRVPVRPTHRLPIASLGNLFRQNDADFPGMPYLTADPERVLQWHAVLSRLPRPWIGISWKGGTDTSAGRERSMTLLEMLPLFDAFPGATFVALNYQPETDGEIAEFEAGTGHRIRHWPRATRMGINYDETAGLVDALDCVVSVQQSVAHLAGALGKPTWVFVPDRPQWRYGTKGDRLPWYGSVALVRQEGKIWPLAVNRAAQQVEAFLNATQV